MCVNKRKIVNRYTGQSLWVDCGKCPACQQKKANKRKAKINNHHKSGQMALFVHLTYLNECVPYVKLSDIRHGIDSIPVYRDYDRSIRRVSGRRNKRRYSLCYHCCNDPIDYLDLSYGEGSQLDSIDDLTVGLLSLRETFNPRLTTKSMEGKIGICYYKDLQNFIKKLKINLQRDYGFNSDCFSYYACSEYGADGLRPHFHLLIFFDPSFEAQFRSAILKSWSYAFRNITSRRLEQAINPASYVASYVNKPSSFPPLLECPAFRQKTSTSQGFGMALKCFTLDQILEKTRLGDLRYNRKIVANGKPCEVSVCYPKYVINRFFPYCKGFSRLTSSEIRWFGQFFDKLSGCFDAVSELKYDRIYFLSRNFMNLPFSDYQKYLDSLNHLIKLPDFNENRYDLFKVLCYFFTFVRPELNVTFDDCLVSAIRLCNKARQYDMTLFDYLTNYYQVWNVYRSTLLRSVHDNDDPFSEWYHYDNIEDYFNGDIRNDSLDELMKITPNDFSYEIDPNFFPENVAMTEHLTEQYNTKIKQRFLNSEVYAAESINDI